MSERLDVELVKRGFTETRNKAKQLILLKYIRVDGKIITKVSFPVDPDNDITVTEQLKYVGRGGEKLEKALSSFGTDVTGKIVLDVGASTGGFTDCLLKNGAAFVYAVDVGSDQLDKSLLLNPKIKNMEKTDIRNVRMTDFDSGIPSLVTMDVSFISSLKILEYIKNLIEYDHDIIVLIKPQFEGARTKKGIVNNKKEHLEILKKYINTAREIGYNIISLEYSPILGGEGNMEFLAYLSSSNNPCGSIDIDYCVDMAYKSLKNVK